MHRSIWLAALRRRTRDTSRTRLFVRPTLEQLEDRITPTGPTFSSLASFNGSNGANPFAGVIADSSGNLYGTTVAGGASGDGTVFELVKGSSTITPLASFNGSNGARPYGTLIMDSSGNLYGTTHVGGASGNGTIFELAQGSSTITTLASFPGDNGTGPYAGLIVDGNGNLYGTTSGSTIFELAKGSDTITPLAGYGGLNTGEGTYAGLVMDSSGNLYGTTPAAFWLAPYPAANGTLFKVIPGSGTFTTLAFFTGNTADNPYGGEDPNGGLVMDSSGNLYGTASQGGAFGDGAVFELAKGSSTPITLASFNGVNGASPYGGLVMDSNGNLYGTTRAGGGSNDGTVFELPQGSGTIVTLASFNGSNGENVYAGLAMDGSGNLYGTTYGGGASGQGTIFKLNVHFSPTVTTNPTSQTVNIGGTATFTAAANGNPTPTVQWQVSSDDGKTWTDINNATATTLTVNNASSALNGNEYRAVFNNSVGTAPTNAATLTVLTPPAITSANSVVFTVEHGGSFIITTSGFPAPTLTIVGFVPSGMTFTDNGNGTASIDGTPSAGTNGTYYIDVTAHNGVGSDATQNFKLTVSSVYVVNYSNGNVYTRNYNMDGSSTATLTNSSGTVASGVSSISYAYNAQGQLTVYDYYYTNGNVFTRTYNSDGSSKAKLTNSSGTLLDDYSYNAQSQLTAYDTYYSNGSVFHRMYAADGSSTATLSNSSGTMLETYNYNSSGVLLYDYIYNAQGRLTASDYYYVNGNVFHRIYASDASSTATLSTSGGTLLQTYKYNSQGQQTSIVYANNGNTLTYTYSSGALSSATLNASTANGGALLQTYKYNAQGQVTSIVYANNGNTLTYTYSSGVLATVSLKNSGGTLLQTYNYNAQGQVSTIKDGSGNLLYTYTYDTLGRVATVTYASNGNVQTYTYNSNGTSSATLDTSGGALTAKYYYDVFGRVMEIDYANGNTYKRIYNSDGTSTATLTNKSGQTIETYTYDAQGNLIGHNP